MANGHAVGVEQMASEVSPMQAAAMLNVSQPYVLKLLEEGKLPSRVAGIHRWIPLTELLAYKAEIKARGWAAAAELTQEAQELGLGY